MLQLRPEPSYSTSTPQCPERALFLAVLLQALLDASSGTDSIHRQHARLFLASAQLERVADLAEIPPDHVPILRDWPARLGVPRRGRPGRQGVPDNNSQNREL